MVTEREVSKYYYHSEDNKVVKHINGGGLLELVPATTKKMNNELYKEYEYRTVFNEAEVYLAKNIAVKGLEMLIYCQDNSLYSIIAMFDNFGKYILKEVDYE